MNPLALTIRPMMEVMVEAPRTQDSNARSSLEIETEFDEINATRYELIDPDYKTVIATSNPRKNRYQKIVPYDKNRVLLIVPEEPIYGNAAMMEPIYENREDKDYINASWVDGFGKSKAFIAAQGG